ncbi:MAG: SCP2 sterol-binding domain-containing protein [Actinobacteria bacterium]|nr:SCP2 sterol-binding domain-containing protein [Actinomycetota bacterium]
MIEVLSDAWCDQLVRHCAASEPTLLDAVIDLQISGAPRGRGRLTIEVTDGRVTRVVAARAADPNLSLRTTFDDVRAMLRGDLDPNVAFMTGDLKTEGPTAPLLALLSAWRRPAVVAARRELAASTDGL